ncbi:MAG: bifunctional phosphoribosylaminoimidazolecarboxamide formyltransferase/IMP cyclohydrolase [Planctomycetota bacterium]|nr:bifunctional phosphoribosylaminoimidazolecarboxamide formyltransferase/IMP cyclohydrolase [Planctomycetota bacterium]
MSDLIPVRRALLSVSDKTGLIEFATALSREFNVELISTGGTARFLRDAGLKVRDVSDVTAFPEMMDGRVKTLHPKIHGGLLALRDHPEHQAAMKTHGIEPIDLLCINLYPFAQTVAKPGVTFDEAIENIDIGGPAMIRSASKNHRFVLVVTSPNRYEKVLGDLRQHNGSSCGNHRLKQAQRAFAQTSEYDAAIAAYLKGVIGQETKTNAQPEPDNQELPEQLNLHLTRRQTLRYGENPHQKAALYVDDRKSNEASVAHAKQLHGKELSYINLLDADAALACVKEFYLPAACIVKHTTPCGCAAANDLPTAFRRAFEGDPLAAFGGIVALNREVDLPTAQAITSIDKLLEVIVAPAFAADALQLLKDRWKNVRLLATGPLGQRDAAEINLHKIAGGWLLQQRDLAGVDESAWKVVSRRQPTERELADLKFAWLVCKHTKSNAIVICKEQMLLGTGAGQMDRPSAARLAIEKAGARITSAVAASDAFFPFPDGPTLLLNAGVTAIVHPGGSLKDQDTIDVANAKNAALLLTGRRHFKH